MRYDEIISLVRSYYDELLQSWKDEIAEKGPVSSQDTDVWVRQGEAMLKSNRTIWDNVDGKGSSLVSQMLRDLKVEVDHTHPDYKIFREEYAHGTVNFAQKVRDYSDNFRNLPDIVLENTSDNPVPLITAKAKHTLSKVIHEFTRQKEVEDAWGTRAKDERKASFDLLIEMFGEGFNINAIDHEQARMVKGMLIKLPKNRTKNPKTRNLPLLKQIEVQGEETISIGSINKYLTTYGQFMSWAQKHGYVQVNPFQGMLLKSNKMQARKDFSDKDIKIILAGLEKLREAESLQGYRYWGALLGLYTGARLNEIASLTCDDVQCENGIWYFDINDEEESKSLKTEAAKRKVPIHPDLIELGFMAFYEDAKTQRKKGDRLLDGLTFSKTTKWGRKLGRWFNDEFLVDLGLKSQGLVFHSFRHTVITRMIRVGVELQIVQNLVGHEPNTVTTAVYMHEYDLKQLQDGINKLSYPK